MNTSRTPIPQDLTAYTQEELDRLLVLHTTVFQEESAPQTLSPLLDELAARAGGANEFSPDAEWASFQAARPDLFSKKTPARRRRAALWTGAAVLALAAAVSVPVLFRQHAPEEAPSTPVFTTPAENPWQYAPLYAMLGTEKLAGRPLRAELPPDGQFLPLPPCPPEELELYRLPVLPPDPNTQEDFLLQWKQKHGEYKTYVLEPQDPSAP